MSSTSQDWNNSIEFYCLKCFKRGFVGHYKGNIIKASGLTKHIKSSPICLSYYVSSSLTSTKGVDFSTSHFLLVSHNYANDLSHEDSSNDNNNNFSIKPDDSQFTNRFGLSKKSNSLNYLDKFTTSFPSEKYTAPTLPSNTLLDKLFIHNKIITHIPKVALDNYLREEQIESDRTVCDTQSTRNSTVNIEEDDTSEDR